ncbi:MAG: hypothetical protein D6797_07085 [Bdellovibrio sp.]|nr:MAG: hypothetical protein D6797_07085 [Bdellovibrio sp.]
MKSIFSFLGLGAFLFLVACQHTPTSVKNRFLFLGKALEDAFSRPLRVTDETVILDVRSAFQFSLSHVDGSFHIDLREFNEKRSLGGPLKKDLSMPARHLARLGIGLKTPVVVVGNGLNGQGREGRLAWTLLYMGLRNVQTVDIEALHLKRVSYPSLPRKVQPLWEPQNQPAWELRSWKSFIEKASSFKSKRLTVIDVRTSKEFFKGSKKLRHLPIKLLHIEWTEFFTEKGRPSLEIKNRLKSVGIHEGDPLVLISNKGVRSAAATYVLLVLGYGNAMNFSPGYESLKK